MDNKDKEKYMIIAYEDAKMRHDEIGRKAKHSSIKGLKMLEIYCEKISFQRKIGNFRIPLAYKQIFL